jgi:hypothetical protein
MCGLVTSINLLSKNKRQENKEQRESHKRRRSYKQQAENNNKKDPRHPTKGTPDSKESTDI